MDLAFWFPTGALVDVVHPFVAMPMAPPIALLHVDLVLIESLMVCSSKEIDR